VAKRVKRKKAARSTTRAQALRGTPAFSERSVLVRYIHEDQRFKKNRPALAAFVASPGEAYLSVNSLEVETVQQIAAYYLARFRTSNPVALTQHKIATYNDAARKAGVAVTHVSGSWRFTDAAGQVQVAYQQHIVPSTPTLLGSRSHSGFECVRAMNELNARKAARRLASKKYHLVTVR
jgi:hypothetical protein